MKHLTQFHGQRTQGGDCGPTGADQIIFWATDGDLELTPAQFRKFGKIPDRTDSDGKVTFSTLPEDLRDGYRGSRHLAEELGWDLGRFEIHKNEPFKLMLDSVGDGKGVILSIDYSVINIRQPKASGDRKFMGNHSISILPPLSLSGAINIHDPLCDGRTRTFDGKPYKYPDGATLIGRDVLRAAAEAYTSGSGVTFMTIKKAKRIADEQPDACAKEKEQIADLTADVALLEKHVAQLKAKRDSAVDGVGLASEALRNAKQQLDAITEALK